MLAIGNDFVPTIESFSWHPFYTSMCSQFGPGSKESSWNCIAHTSRITTKTKV